MLTFKHPEIEHLGYFDLKDSKLDDAEVKTSVDVLDMWKIRTRGAAVDELEPQLQLNLSHNELDDHIGTVQEGRDLCLRILFLRSIPLQSPKEGITAAIDNTQVALSTKTADYLIRNLGVCPLFLSGITSVPWVLDTGNSLFKTYSTEDNDTRTLSALQGFFHCSDKGRPVHVWFQHELQKQLSTYIIHGCPERVQTAIGEWASDPKTRNNLLRPLAIDSLIIDDVTWAWSKAVVENAAKLLEYEHYTEEENKKHIDDAVQSLHHLSQHFHILQEELNGIVEQLDYLIDVHKLVFGSMWTGPSCVADSLRLLRSRTHKWHSSVTNWKERTQVRIHLFFNLSAQRDNLTNMQVAQLTSEIAKATYKDSSSMITIAVLTLVFLPGTFVSGIFSMPFNQSLATRPGAGWQLYAAITVPLTFCVLLAWNSWRRYRNQSEPKADLQKPDGQEQPIASTIAEPNTGSQEKVELGETHTRIQIILPPRTPPPQEEQSRFSDSSFEDLGDALGGTDLSIPSTPIPSSHTPETNKDDLSRGSPSRASSIARENSLLHSEIKGEIRAQSRLSTHSRAIEPRVTQKIDAFDAAMQTRTPVPDTARSEPQQTRSCDPDTAPTNHQPFAAAAHTPVARGLKNARSMSLDRSSREVNNSKGARGSRTGSDPTEFRPSQAQDDIQIFGTMEGRGRFAFDLKEKFVAHGQWANNDTDANAFKFSPPRVSTPKPTIASKQTWAQQQQTSSRKKIKLFERTVDSPSPLSAGNLVPNMASGFGKRGVKRPLSPDPPEPASPIYSMPGNRGIKRPLSPDPAEPAPSTRLRYASQSPNPDRGVQSNSGEGDHKTRQRHSGRAGRGFDPARDNHGIPGRIVPPPPQQGASETRRGEKRGQRPRPLALGSELYAKTRRRNDSSTYKRRDAFASLEVRDRRTARPRGERTPLAGMRWDDDGAKQAWDVADSLSSSPSPSPARLELHQWSRSHSPLDLLATGAMTSLGIDNERGRPNVRASQMKTAPRTAPVRPRPFVLQRLPIQQPLPVRAAPVTPNIILTPPRLPGLPERRDGGASDSPTAHQSAGEDYLDESLSLSRIQHSQGESFFSNTSTLVQRSPWPEGNAWDDGEGTLRSVTGSWPRIGMGGGKLHFEEGDAGEKGNKDDDTEVALLPGEICGERERVLPTLIAKLDPLQSGVEQESLDQSAHKSQRDPVQVQVLPVEAT